MEKIILVGGGGHCKVLVDIIESEGRFEIAGILDRNKDGVLGIPVIGDDEDLQELFSSGIKNAAICVGGLSNPKVRERIYDNLKKIGFQLPVLKHPNSIVSKYAEIGEGTCIMAGAVINPCAKINEICVINTSAVIEHDCTLKCNVNVSPRAVVLGDVEIRENTLIGSGSIIKQGVKIGRNSMIGAGSLVLKNISDEVLAFGNPAREIRSIGE